MPPYIAKMFYKSMVFCNIIQNRATKISMAVLEIFDKCNVDSIFEKYQKL